MFCLSIGKKTCHAKLCLCRIDVWGCVLEIKQLLVGDFFVAKIIGGPECLILNTDPKPSLKHQFSRTQRSVTAHYNVCVYARLLIRE